MAAHDCTICGEIDGRAEGDLIAQALGGAYVRRVLIESPNFAVLPCIGALAPGHVLVCTKGHHLRFADCPEAWDAEYRMLLERVGALLAARALPRIHLFEHGSGMSGRLACSIDHAHQHLLPCDVPAPTNLSDLGECVSVPQNLVAVKAAVCEQEYLLHTMLGRTDATVVLAKENGIDSQWMRRHFAAKLGCAEEWDWRVHPRLDVLRQTCEMFEPETAGSGAPAILAGTHP